MDVEGFIIGLLTCSGVSLGLLLKILSLTTFIMGNLKFLLSQQMETKCTGISDTLEDRIRPQEYIESWKNFLKERNAFKREKCKMI